MSMTMIDLEKRINMALEQDSKSFSDFNLWEEAIQYAPPLDLLDVIIDIQAEEDSAILMAHYDLLFAATVQGIKKNFK